MGPDTVKATDTNEGKKNERKLSKKRAMSESKMEVIRLLCLENIWVKLILLFLI